MMRRRQFYLRQYGLVWRDPSGRRLGLISSTHFSERLAMNPGRIALAAIGAFVTYFVLGGLMFMVLPMLRTQYAK